MMMSGNGTAKKKIATKAAAARACRGRLLRERRPMRIDGLDDDRQHGRLQAEERRRHEADLTPLRIDDAERHQRDDAGQDEQPAGHDAAARAMHQPADISGELLGLGAGQQHAIVERMHEAAFGHPPFFFDENAVHHRDLPGRAAEAQRGDAQPDAEGLADRNAMSGLLPAVARGTQRASRSRQAPFLLVGQLWVSLVASRLQR